MSSILLTNVHVDSISRTYIYNDIDDLPHKQTGIVLGAFVHQGGGLSEMYKDRVNTAIELYNKKKIEKILISGDHGNKSYDEVNSAKDYLLEAQIPARDIFLDHAGFDTYDSLYRARDIFRVDSLIIITQEFHLPRAVYIAGSLGHDVVGIKADRHTYPMIWYSEIRETFSKIKAFGDITFNSSPRYLGEEIPITGDSKRSWDEE